MTEEVHHAEALAAAFSEWHRRWIEEPDRFYSKAQSLAEPDDSYGDACAKYLLQVMGEIDEALG